MAHQQTSTFTTTKIILAFIFGIIAPGIGHIYLGFIRRGLIIILVISCTTVLSSYLLSFPLDDPVEGIPFSLGQLYEILLILLPLRVWQTYDLLKVINKFGNMQTRRVPIFFKYMVTIIIATYLVYLTFPVIMYFTFGYANPFFRGQGESMLPTFNNDSTVVEKNSIAGATFDSLLIGDIISFSPPNQSNETISHRIVHIKTDQNGEKIIMTKGDGNVAPIMGVDYPLREENYLGKTVFIFNDPFNLYMLEDVPVYLVIVPAISFIFYYLKKNNLYTK